MRLFHQNHEEIFPLAREVEEGFDERMKRVAERPVRRGRIRKDLTDERADVAVDFLEDGEENLFFAAFEVIVERSLPEFGPFGNLVQRGAGLSFLSKYRPGGVQHSLTAHQALALAAGETHVVSIAHRILFIVRLIRHYVTD